MCKGLVDSGAVGGYRAQGFVVAPTFGPRLVLVTSGTRPAASLKTGCWDSA